MNGLQELLFAWYRANGGYATVPRAVARANEEMAEAVVDAVIGDGHLAEELADVVICLFVAASLANINLMEAVGKKMQINSERKWEARDGCLYHVKP